jgi:hypothetical protein
MADDNGRHFDKTIRDHHHALRRMQCRRAISIVNWTIVPWVVAAALVALVLSCL